MSRDGRPDSDAQEPTARLAADLSLRLLELGGMITEVRRLVGPDACPPNASQLDLAMRKLGSMELALGTMRIRVQCRLQELRDERA